MSLAKDRIVAIDVWPLDVPLTDQFVIAKGALTSAQIGFVRVRLADGSIGFGELAPFTALTGETRERSVETVRALGPALKESRAAEWLAIGPGLAARAPHEPAARAAIECAVADAHARSQEIPLHQLFARVFDGEASSARVPARLAPRETDITLPILAEARIDELAHQWHARGFRIFKLKVGGDVRADLARVERLAGRYPDVSFILDANQGFDRSGARRFLDGLALLAARVRLFEQPLARADIEGMSALRSARVVPIAADESVFSPQDARAVIAAGAADCINLKIMKSGLAETLAIARAAREAGVGLMIGGMMESRLAMAFSYALVLGGAGIDHLDLDTPLLLAEDPLVGGYRYDGPRMSVWNGPGVDMKPRQQPPANMSDR